VLECFSKILNELNHAIDKYSKDLIVNNIELFLNYCSRFYDRQFITRENLNKAHLAKFEYLIDDYFETKKTKE
jgi:AraC family transcriptional activator of pobA